MHPRTTNPVTIGNYAKLLAYCHRFLARDAFAICEDFVLTNVKNLNLIDLLKLAFEFNWDKLKNKLKEVMTEARKCYCCGNNVQAQCAGGHWTQGIALPHDSSVVKNKDLISKLPAEIQAFFLHAFLDAA